MTNPYSAVQELIAHHPRFFIISHLRPDGDAYGSALGLGLVLRALGKDVIVANEEGIQPPFAFLPESSTVIQTPAEALEPDRVIIAVDTSDPVRLGPLFTAWQRQPDLNIDHHISNPGYARQNVVEATAPATAQVLYEIMEACSWPIPPPAAANLYVGLMTDTGSFRYRQTSARTLEIASRLITAGADPTDLSQACFQSFKASRLRLMREMLNATHWAGEDRIAWFILTPEMYARSGATSDETEGLIEHLQSVATVQVAFVLEIMPDGLTRASLRSRGSVDVQKICALFGGGGHRLAAGLRNRQTPLELEPQILAAIREQLELICK